MTAWPWHQALQRRGRPSSCPWVALNAEGLSLCLPEEGDHEGVLELGVSSRVEAVHATEALAGWPATQHLHIPLLRQLLAAGVGHLPGHDQLQQDVAVLCEHRGPRVVEPECLGRGVPHLDGPQCLRDAWVGDTGTQTCHELPRKRLSSQNCDQSTEVFQTQPARSSF